LAAKKPSVPQRSYGAKLKPQKGVNPENRPFSGREKKLKHQTHLPGPLVAALDILARFRATQEPIQKILQPILKQRRFGARERNEIRDWIFALQRQKNQLENQLEKCIHDVGGVPPNRRQKDLALLLATMPIEQRQKLQTSSGNLLTSALNRFLEHLPEDNTPKNLPSWLQKKLQEQFGEDASTIEEHFLKKAYPAFAMNTEVISRKELLEQLDSKSIKATAFDELPDGFWCTEHLPLTSLDAELQEAVWPMDLGSQLIAHLLGVQPSDQVLDMCAGGGGKTKALLRYPCQLTATDISQPRITATKKRTRAHNNVSFHCLDMSQPQLKAASFDRILVDAPCSGIGTIRRHPDILERFSVDQIETYVTMQKQLLEQASRLCRQGGYVLYATCSFLAEENDDIVSWAQNGLPLEPINLDLLSPKNVLNGHDLKRTNMYLLPHEFLSDGFFVAAFQKQ
jgi:16S rRNA (cytosine967-C5)-methyltransferase